ncbi:MAG: HAD-IIIA family hydrolase [Succinivibrionaceae bacterium]|nr:HAD-IIIA family hydrolase [Succinivibrionaceae bacterium]
MNNLTNDIKLIIFDVDGTIMDSIGRIIECMQESAQKYQVAIPTPQEVKNIIGITLRHAVEVLFPEQTQEMVDLITDEYRRLYNLWEDERPTALYPGTMETLETLKGRGYKLAIATGKSQRGLARLYRDDKLYSLFSGAVTGDQAKSKPDPMMLEKLLGEFGLQPDQAVMIGDSNLDLRMAKNIGMPSIGITWGVHSGEILAKEEPAALIDNISELLELF